MTIVFRTQVGVGVREDCGADPRCLKPASYVHEGADRDTGEKVRLAVCTAHDLMIRTEAPRQGVATFNVSYV
jgi:hypothetical protein